MMHLFLANGGAGGTNLDPLYDKALFWILAVLAVSAAIAMILVRHAVHCALMLAVVMLCLAVMYAMQGAPFLAFVQVIVYTGAVLMLFLFVVMLIGTNSAESLVETIRGQRLWAALAGIGLAVPAHRRHRARGDRHAGPADQRQQHRQPDRAGAADLHHLRVPV